MGWGGEQNRERLDAVSFLVRSRDWTGHHFFSDRVATNRLQKNHPVMWIGASTNPHSPMSDTLSPLQSSFILYFDPTPVSPNLSFTSPFSVLANDLVSYFREKNRSQEARTHSNLCTYPYHVFLFLKKRNVLLPLLSQCGNVPPFT